MDPRTPSSQVFYEPLNLEIFSSLPFIPFIIGKTFPDPKYVSGPFGADKDSFNLYQFEYITEGVSYAEVDGKEYTLHAGDFLYVKKSCYRKMWNDKDTPGGKLHISAKGTFVDGIVDAFLPKSNVVICKSDVCGHFARMFDLCRDSEKNDIALINELGVELLRILQKVSLSIKNSEVRPDTVCTPEDIMHYITSNLQSRFTLEDLSDIFYLSPSQIVHIFKQKFGTTPMKYAQNRRVELAKYYLSKTEMPISEIPNVAPIGDRQYFSNVFRRQVGMSPREYRNQHKKTRK